MLIGTSQLRFFNSPSPCLTFVTHRDVGNAAARRSGRCLVTLRCMPWVLC